MDSLETSRQYIVLSISRLHLQSLGFTTEQITRLSDDDMQAIADGLQEEFSKLVGGFAQHIRFITDLYLAEKEHEGDGTLAG